VLHQTAVGARDGYLNGITISDSALRKTMFSAHLNHELAGYDPLDGFREIYDRAPGPDFLSKATYLDLKTYLVDDVLTKVDRASMANSLEVRVPLLDHHVVEFAYSLPTNMKLRDGKGKHLLRKTMTRFLPDGFLDAPKMGFRIPFIPWMRGPLRSGAEKVIFHESQTSSLLDKSAVRKLWNNFQRDGNHLGDVMGILFAFTLWSSSASPSESIRNQAALESTVSTLT
jgi:asparagine synthase (glutamine-hydrolysing)